MNKNLKNIAKKIRDSGVLGYCFIQCLLKLHALYFSFFSDKNFVEYEFKQAFGRKLDWNNLRTLGEKMQWIKLYGMTPLHAKCADKILVRDYVRQTIGDKYLVPKVLSTYCVRDICPENIKQKSFVMKVNHDSGGVLICQDCKIFDWRAARKQLKTWLRRDFYMVHREQQYRNIKRGILVEEFLQFPNKKNLIEYRPLCFHGKLKLIQVKVEKPDEIKINYYTPDWQLLPIKLNHYDNLDESIPKPKLLEEMKIVAEKLSAPFKFVRVDLYILNNKIFFGEMTFTPSAGLSKFEPDEFELKFGDYLNLDS